MESVFVRSKKCVGAKTPWSVWGQCYPSFIDIRPQPPHSPTTVPHVADNKEWPEFDAKVAPTLREFYDGTMQHGINIPRAEKEEMLRFLDEGPPESGPPEFINWEQVMTHLLNHMHTTPTLTPTETHTGIMWRCRGGGCGDGAAIDVAIARLTCSTTCTPRRHLHPPNTHTGRATTDQ